MPNSKSYDIIFKILEQNRKQDERAYNLDKRLASSEALAKNNKARIGAVEKDIKKLAPVYTFLGLLKSRLFLIVISGLVIFLSFGKDALIMFVNIFLAG